MCRTENKKTASTTTNEISVSQDHEECWFEEEIAPGWKDRALLTKRVVSCQSSFQKIEVIETVPFGKMLILDGLTQSTQRDEFIYHESLVHPALLAKSSSLSSVFIGGGGELSTAREVLKHKSVERVVMVDLDQVVVDVCKTYLPEWGGECVLDDPRLHLVIGDAHQYLMETDETFDVIIMDINDPVEAGPGIVLYTQEFYQHAVTQRLNQPGGIFVTQAGVAHSVFNKNDKNDESPACFAPIRNTLQSVFDHVMPYTSNIPSFGGDWGFIMAFNVPANEKISTGQDKENPLHSPYDEDTLNDLIEERIEGDLDYYDGQSHVRMFHLTKPLRKSLALEERIITGDNPIYMIELGS